MLIQKFQKQWNQGQSTIEFAALFMIVVGALIASQYYFKRAVQGRWKTSTDELSDELYDPFLTDSDVTYRVASNSVVTVQTIDDGGGYWTIREDQTNSIDTRSGTKLIGGFN